jgi:hypothetical protein
MDKKIMDDLEMKLTCEDCSKLNCKKLCDKVKDEYEDLIDNAYAKEDALSHTKPPKNKSSDEIQIEDLRNIDLGRVYGSDPEPEIDWEKTPPQPEAVDIDGTEERSLKDRIMFATRREDLKLRRRFDRFLKCKTIVDIAITAGTSKQNIQKQFQSVIKKVNKMLSPNHLASETVITPLKFKKKVYSIYSQ